MRTSMILVLLFVIPARGDDVSAVRDDDGIVFRIGKADIARYRTGGRDLAKPYLWPVEAPGEVPVTRQWPIGPATPGGTTDHVHQKSVWFCHGEVVPEGMGPAVDFWTEAKAKDGTPAHGRIVCTNVGEPKAIANGGVEVGTKNEWRTPAGVKILAEERTLRVYDLKEGRLFCFDCKLIANTCPITFDDTKEGSFGLRVHDELRPSQKTGAVVTSSSGAAVRPPAWDNMSMWGQPADWIDYSGKVGGKEVGVAVFEHPDNPARGGWHARAYGLLAANPFAREKSGFPSQKGKKELVRIKKDGTLTLKYAVYAHTGDVKTGKVAEAYATYRK